MRRQNQGWAEVTHFFGWGERGISYSLFSIESNSICLCMSHLSMYWYDPWIFVACPLHWGLSTIPFWSITPLISLCSMKICCWLKPMENFWWKLRYRWISFIGNWFSCLEREINSFSQSGSNLFMNKPINNLIVSVRLKFFQNVSYLTLPPNGSLVLRKILCIHLRQKLVWQTCFSARSVCRKLSYEGYDGKKKNRQIRENAIPHTSPKRNPLEGIIWGLCRTEVW